MVDIARRGMAKPKKRNLWWVWVTAPLVLLVAMPVFVLLTIGLIPTMVAFLIDRRPEKYAAFCVGGFNLCGVIPLALELFVQGRTFPALGHIIGSPLNWLIMYGAAALGWIVFSWTPEAVLRLMAFQDRKRIATLHRRQEQLVEEWGTGIIPPRGEDE